MTYSIIDVETTGLSPARGDRVLEIGIATLAEDGTITAALDTLVNPERTVGATHIHGVSQDMVADAPMFKDIIPVIEDILDGTVIAAHNAPFDLGFLRSEYAAGGLKLPFVKAACTLVMARAHLSQLSSKSLESCRRHLGITDQGAHNALADAMATAQLLKHFLDNHGPDESAKPYIRLHESGGEPGLFDFAPRLKPR